MKDNTCRCGWDGVGEHPCHGDAYACRKPSKERLYNFRPACLAGMQMKLEFSDTFACDECWVKFLEMLKEKQ